MQLKSRAQRGFSAYAPVESTYAAAYLDSARGLRRNCLRETTNIAL